MRDQCYPFVATMEELKGSAQWQGLLLYIFSPTADSEELSFGSYCPECGRERKKQADRERQERRYRKKQNSHAFVAELT